MSTWLIALIPIFSLTIVFVFGFVGCALEKSGLPGGPSDGGDGGPTTKYTDVIVADKPLAYWRLGEFEGPTAAADQIGVDAAHPTGLHPGTYHSGTPIPAAPDSSPAPGTLSFGSPGLLTSDPAHSVDFDGGYAEIAHNGELNTGQFSVEAWIHPAWPQGDNSDRIVVASYVFGPPTTGFTLEKNTQDHFEILIGTGAGGWATLVGDTSFQKGKDETYHLVATYDGTTLKIYEDGNLTNQMPVAGYQPAGATPIDIGVGEPTANKLYPIHGRIQDVAIYDHALDAAAVQKHFLQGTT